MKFTILKCIKVILIYLSNLKININILVSNIVDIIKAYILINYSKILTLYYIIDRCYNHFYAFGLSVVI